MYFIFFSKFIVKKTTELIAINVGSNGFSCESHKSWIKFATKFMIHNLFIQLF